MLPVRSIRCPNCNQHVLQKSAEGIRFRLKGQIRSDDEGLHAKCYWCNTSVTLPVDVALSQPAPAPGERFILQKGKKGTSKDPST